MDNNRKSKKAEKAVKKIYQNARKKQKQTPKYAPDKGPIGNRYTGKRQDRSIEGVKDKVEMDTNPKKWRKRRRTYSRDEGDVLNRGYQGGSNALRNKIQKEKVRDLPRKLKSGAKKVSAALRGKRTKESIQRPDGHTQKRTVVERPNNTTIKRQRTVNDRTGKVVKRGPKVKLKKSK